MPFGGGWEISFCVGVASTNIIKTFPKELADLGQGRFGPAMMKRMQEVEVREVRSSAGAQLGAVENENGVWEHWLLCWLLFA